MTGYEAKDFLQRKTEKIVQEGAAKQSTHKPSLLEDWQGYLDEKMKHALGLEPAPVQRANDEQEQEEKSSHRMS